MTEYDKKAKVGDCSFILLTKFPSGDVHVVNVPSRELQDWMVRKEIFEVTEKKLEHIDFKPIL